MRSVLAVALLALACFLPAACTTNPSTGKMEVSMPGTTAPLTVNEQIGAGYATVTAIRTSASTLLKAGKITADDAQNVQSSADAARAGLDVARTISNTNPAAATSKLTAVSTALHALQAYLVARGATN